MKTFQCSLLKFSVYCLRTRMLRIHVKVKMSPSQLPCLLFYDLGSPAHGVLLRLVWRQHHLQPVHLWLWSASHRLEHKHPRSAAGEMTSSYCHLTGKCHQKSVWNIKHWNLWVGLKGGWRKLCVDEKLSHVVMYRMKFLSFPAAVFWAHGGSVFVLDVLWALFSSFVWGRAEKGLALAVYSICHAH